jgi:hypothetical protein
MRISQIKSILKHFIKINSDNIKILVIIVVVLSGLSYWYVQQDKQDLSTVLLREHLRMMHFCIVIPIEEILEFQQQSLNQESILLLLEKRFDIQSYLKRMNHKNITMLILSNKNNMNEQFIVILFEADSAANQYMVFFFEPIRNYVLFYHSQSPTYYFISVCTSKQFTLDDFLTKIAFDDYLKKSNSFIVIAQKQNDGRIQIDREKLLTVLSLLCNSKK